MFFFKQRLHQMKPFGNGINTLFYKQLKLCHLPVMKRCEHKQQKCFAFSTVKAFLLINQLINFVIACARIMHDQ